MFKLVIGTLVLWMLPIYLALSIVKKSFPIAREFIPGEIENCKLPGPVSSLLTISILAPATSP